MWTSLQTFANGFISNASSTFTTGLLSMNGGASTTNFTDQIGAAGGAWPFTASTNYGVAVQSTSTPIWATAGLVASSTSYFVNASSTALTVSGTAFFGTATSTTLNSNSATIGSLTAGALSLGSLGTLAGGFLSQASSTVTGLLTALNSSSSLATIGTLWLPGVTNALLSTDSAGRLTATSTPTASSFITTGATASLFPYASSTALTVSGVGDFGVGAFTSTTGTTTVASGQGFAVGGTQFVVQQGSGNVGIGTASPSYALDVNGDVNVASGKCFRVNGACIGYVVKLAAIYATSTPSGTATSTVVFTGAQGSAPSYSGTTLTLPSNTSYIVAEVWGGGGGGAGSTPSSGINNGGGGGGGGGYSQTLHVSPLSSKYYYNIGKGGSGGVTGSPSVAGSGNASYFGTGLATSTANGGDGGNSTNPGSGGDASGGSVNLSGSAGMNGKFNDGINSGFGGAGGSSPRGGGGGKSMGSSSGGYPGEAFGGGGGGGTGNNSSGNNGGTGGTGGLVITVYATSSPTDAGNDYAEMFPVSNPGITAGDIVAVDAGVPITMKLASAGESAPLAGIIATNPGQVLGDINATGERPVALSGRVPAKVNLENGPILIGDRIAPSSVPGVGKKAGPFDDSVGIALESFSGADGEAQGTVTVFIDLQRGIPLDEIGSALLATISSTSALGGAFDFVGNLLSAISARIGAAAAWNAATATTTATTTAATSTQQTALGLFFEALFARIKAWFADAANGIGDFFAKRIVGDQLCARKSDGSLECLTGDQLAAVVTATRQTLRPSSTEGTAPTRTEAAATDVTTSSVPTTPPTISINGNNLAHINIGDTYQDLGATAKDSAGHDLGVKTFLNGLLVSDIVIDTSTTTTDIIDYVASDTWGNTATATRSVIIEPPAPSVTDSDPPPAVVPDAPSLAPEEPSAEIPVASDAPAGPTDTAAQE